jgi:hypothetical protein
MIMLRVERHHVVPHTHNLQSDGGYPVSIDPRVSVHVPACCVTSGVMVCHTYNLQSDGGTTVSIHPSVSVRVPACICMSMLRVERRPKGATATKIGPSVSVCVCVPVCLCMSMVCVELYIERGYSGHDRP